MNADLGKLADGIKAREGLRFFAYDDATAAPIRPNTSVKGHPTIGYGRSLDTRGITTAEANLLLSNDISLVVEELSEELPWTEQLDDVRCRVLLEMAFNMGISGLLEFHDTLRHVQNGQYNLASVSMLDSEWAKQVGTRAEILSRMMASGQDVESATPPKGVS